MSVPVSSTTAPLRSVSSDSLNGLTTSTTDLSKCNEVHSCEDGATNQILRTNPTSTSTSHPPVATVSPMAALAVSYPGTIQSTFATSSLHPPQGNIKRKHLHKAENQRNMMKKGSRNTRALLQQHLLMSALVDSSSSTSSSRIDNTIPTLLNKAKTSELKGGRRGDPRMHRAVAARLANPELSLFEALIAGGFKFPDLKSKGRNGGIYDSDNVLLSQRKNQLSRRLRLLARKKKRQREEEYTFLANQASSSDPLVLSPETPLPQELSDNILLRQEQGGQYYGDVLGSNAGHNNLLNEDLLLSAMLLKNNNTGQLATTNSFLGALNPINTILPTTTQLYYPSIIPIQQQGVQAALVGGVSTPHLLTGVTAIPTVSLLHAQYQNQRSAAQLQQLVHNHPSQGRLSSLSPHLLGLNNSHRPEQQSSHTILEAAHQQMLNNTSSSPQLLRQEQQQQAASSLPATTNQQQEQPGSCDHAANLITQNIRDRKSVV